MDAITDAHNKKIEDFIKENDPTKEELSAFKKANPKSQRKTIADGFSESGLTYIKERAQERRRQRSLSLDKDTRATVWGDAMEHRVYQLVPLDYLITSQETSVHPKVKTWTGSKDMIVPGVKVSEIKCYEPKKFCDYADVLLKKDVDLFRDKFPEEYWQIVSNAAINEVPKGEATLYLPYDDEVEELIELIHELDDDKYRYILDDIRLGNIYKLPFQPKESKYPHLVQFEFEVPQEDIKFLESRVREAEALIKTF